MSKTLENDLLDHNEDLPTPRNLFEKYNFSEEQKRLWKYEVFSWGFNAGLGGYFNKQILEVSDLIQTFSEGYFLARFLKMIS